MGALAARAFADQGCKTAAVLTSSPVFEGMENRMHGFRLEGEQHGLTILANRYCDNSIRGGYEAVSHRLRPEWKQQLPDAVFCGSSAIAHGALRAFCEAGYIGEKLPRLIAVGNGPEESDAFSIPSLSVVYLPMLVGMMETRASVMAASIPEFLTTPVNAPAAKTMETIRNAACA